MPAALVLAVADRCSRSSADQVRDQLSGRAGVAAVAAVAGLSGSRCSPGASAAGPRRSSLAAVAALPVRIPLTVGGETANLLLPLYAVIAGGVLAALLRAAGTDGAGPAPADPARDDRRAGARRRRRAVRAAGPLLRGRRGGGQGHLLLLRPVRRAVPAARRPAVDADGSSSARWRHRRRSRCCAPSSGIVQFFTRDLLLANEKVLTANELKPYFRVNSPVLRPEHLRALPRADDGAGRRGDAVDARSGGWSTAAPSVLGVLWARPGAVAVGVELRRAGRRPRRARRAALALRGRSSLTARRRGGGRGRRRRGRLAERRRPRGPLASTRVDKATSGRAELVKGGLRDVRATGRVQRLRLRRPSPREYRDRENLLSTPARPPSRTPSR